jgi:hypothetical protein
MHVYPDLFSRGNIAHVCYFTFEYHEKKRSFHFFRNKIISKFIFYSIQVNFAK